jgi:hypothetical protein
MTWQEDLLMRKTISVVLIVSSFFMLQTVMAKPNVKFGEWQMTTVVTGLPIKMAPRTTRVCITEKNMVPDKKQDKDCKMEWKAKGNTISWTAVCNNGGQGNGHAVYNYDKMTGQNNFSVKGQKFAMKSKITGKWVSAKCSK